MRNPLHHTLNRSISKIKLADGLDNSFFGSASPFNFGERIDFPLFQSPMLETLPGNPRQGLVRDLLKFLTQLDDFCFLGGRARDPVTSNFSAGIVKNHR